MLQDQFLECGYELLVVLMQDLAADPHPEHFAGTTVEHLDRRRNSLVGSILEPAAQGDYERRSRAVVY